MTSSEIPNSAEVFGLGCHFLSSQNDIGLSGRLVGLQWVERFVEVAECGDYENHSRQRREEQKGAVEMLSIAPWLC